MLADRGHAERYVCPHLDASRNYDLPLEGHDRMDVKALTQHLSNTEAVKRLGNREAKPDTFFETLMAQVLSDGQFDLEFFLTSKFDNSTSR